MGDRERGGREASPSGAIMDAQAARSGGVGVDGERGYDPARRVVERKRHALTDSDIYRGEDTARNYWSSAI